MAASSSESKKTSKATSTSSSSPSSLSSKTNEKKEEEFEFFFGNKSPFSQHHPAKFEIDGIVYNCAEQYMMHQKAVLFKDAAMAKKILACSNPVEQKRSGRKVQNFDKEIWAKRSKGIVKEASLAKFSQNPDLLEKFLATHPRTLVEASPRDRLWGIGLGASNPKARDRSQWRGRNLLGQILTEAREELRKDEEEAAAGMSEEADEKKEASEKKTTTSPKPTKKM